MSGAEHPQAVWPGAVRLLHWISAVMIITMLVVGTIMVRVDDTGIRFDLYQSHKAFGFVVLSVTFLRLLTRLTLAPRGPVIPGALAIACSVICTWCAVSVDCRGRAQRLDHGFGNAVANSDFRLWPVRFARHCSARSRDLQTGEDLAWLAYKGAAGGGPSACCRRAETPCHRPG
jgi:hypothetical protein